MNVTSAQLGPVVAESPAPAEAQAAGAQPVPAVEPAPKSETSDNGGEAPSMPASQEVVNVHTDTSTGERILVYDFMDPRSGTLIFQIPSQQILSLAQAIQQRLEQMEAKQSGGKK